MLSPVARSVSKEASAGSCVIFGSLAWLVGTSLSETCETRNARGTVMSTWSLSPENRAASVWRLALPGSSTLRAAGLLCPSRTPIHHFLLLSGHQQAGLVQQVDLLPLAILKRTTFHLFYFVMLEGRALSTFSVTGKHTQIWLLWRLYWWSSQHRHDLSKSKIWRFFKGIFFRMLFKLAVKSKLKIKWRKKGKKGDILNNKIRIKTAPKQTYQKLCTNRNCVCVSK